MTAVIRFSAFCGKYGITRPFPVDELSLCHFVAAMAKDGLAPATVKTYLAGIRHVQIMRGLPEPSQSGSLPRLKLVQVGVARARLTRGPDVALARLCKQRLPITAEILSGLLEVWSPPSGVNQLHDFAMLRAAVTTCFFGFFRAGEITVPLVKDFNERIHLAWGDISADKASPPTMIRVHLKQSKCDQFGKGVDVFVGRTGTEVCPVVEILRYVSC